MNVRTNLMLPEELVAAVDVVAGPRGRSRYVAEVLARQIKRERWYVGLKAAAGAWEDHPLFPNDDSVAEWVSAGRRESHDPWTDPSRT
jgi:hypothetical protein